MILNKRDLTPEELAKPYSKYYFRELIQPDPELMAKFQNGPMDWHDALEPEEINRLLDPGYLPGETGWCVMLDGTAYIATLFQMPGVTLDMVNWWFAWHALEDLRYMIWFPGSHFAIKVDDATRKKLTDPALPPRAKVENVTHMVCEDIFGTGKIPPFHAMPFVTPEDAGFDRSRYDAAKNVTIIAAVSRPDEDLPPERFRILVHFFRETENGVELRTRTWRGCTLVDGKKKVMLPQGHVMDMSSVVPLTEHSSMEYTNLAKILPQLYAEMEGKIQ